MLEMLVPLNYAWSTSKRSRAVVEASVIGELF